MVSGPLRQERWLSVFSARLPVCASVGKPGDQQGEDLQHGHHAKNVADELVVDGSLCLTSAHPAFEKHCHHDRAQRLAGQALGAVMVAVLLERGMSRGEAQAPIDHQLVSDILCVVAVLQILSLLVTGFTYRSAHRQARAEHG